MKQFYLLILSTVAFFAVEAQTTSGKKKEYINGEFLSATSWNPIGKPQNGDTLVIKQGTSLTIDDDINIENLDITLNIVGTLSLAHGKLSLSPKSTINLASGAKITPIGNNNSNKIYIGGDLKYESKVGEVPGPAKADVNTVYGASGNVKRSGFLDLTATSLPVIFTSFTVSKSSASISVKWSTSEEINADVFQVERSEDGKTWRTLGKVKAVGNSSIVNNYTFTDNALISNTAYYRIKQVDIDGKFIYTEVKAIANQSNLAISNNVNIVAAGNNVVVNFTKEVKGAVIVRLISFGGQVIAQQSYNQPSQQIVFNKTAVNKGNYIVFVSNNLDLTASKQIAF